MKLASYIADGKPSFGVVVGDGVVTMNERLGGRSRRCGMRWPAARSTRCAGGRRRRQARPQARRAQVPAGDPQSRENPMRRHQLQIPRRRARPRGAELPNIFTRFIDTLVRARRRDDRARRPRTTSISRASSRVVIGKGGRHIEAARTRSTTSPATPASATARARLHQVLAGRQQEFPGTGPLGPWMVTADEIPDPTKLTLTTRLNGQEMQRPAPTC